MVIKTIDTDEYKVSFEISPHTKHRGFYSKNYVLRAFSGLRKDTFPLEFHLASNDWGDKLKIVCSNCYKKDEIFIGRLVEVMMEKNIYVIKHTCLGVDWFAVLESNNVGFETTNFYLSRDTFHWKPQ